MSADWFRALTGFSELPYDQTRSKFEISGQTLRSKVNGRSCAIGTLETPSLAELRERAAGVAGKSAGQLRVSSIVDDATRLHCDPANRNALFQVASQFNLLEMTGPDVSPEAGVTRYMNDHTQGPACAIAAGAATIYRNYFAPIRGQIGQTRGCQIDCLADLGDAFGNRNNGLWTMTNGYALCTTEGLRLIETKLARLDAPEKNRLRDLLRVGLHTGVEVTAADAPDLDVSQIFCSALPIAYMTIPAEGWRNFATLVLEGAYEATLWAAVVNAHARGSNVVFLTLVGGGAFGNATTWIHSAIERALNQVRGLALDVRIVSYQRPTEDLLRLVQRFASSSPQ